ncbi:hypothetical protein [Streptomyces sp. NPDC001530]|uniref:hypothetical protein n=1 Tax=Streptomyces sp. NPDC001530 TaxID=3364582 RepID=UPI003693B48E
MTATVPTPPVRKTLAPPVRKALVPPVRKALALLLARRRQQPTQHASGGRVAPGSVAQGPAPQGPVASDPVAPDVWLAGLRLGS